MFSPTNESYVHLTVESTLDRHLGETDEERAQRCGESYQPSRLSTSLLSVLHALGHVLLSIGQRLEALPSTPSTTPSDARQIGGVAHSQSR